MNYYTPKPWKELTPEELKALPDDEHECDEDGEPDSDICPRCKEHAGFCSVCGVSGCCGY